MKHQNQIYHLHITRDTYNQRMDEMDYVIFYNKTNTTSNGNSTVRPLRPSRLGDCRWAGKMIIIKDYRRIKYLKDKYWT